MQIPSYIPVIISVISVMISIISLIVSATALVRTILMQRPKFAFWKNGLDSLPATPMHRHLDVFQVFLLSEVPARVVRMWVTKHDSTDEYISDLWGVEQQRKYKASMIPLWEKDSRIYLVVYDVGIDSEIDVHYVTRNIRGKDVKDIETLDLGKIRQRMKEASIQ